MFYQYTLPMTHAAKNKEKAPERNIIVVGGGLAGMSAAIEVIILVLANFYDQKYLFNIYRLSCTVLKWRSLTKSQSKSNFIFMNFFGSES